MAFTDTVSGFDSLSYAQRLKAAGVDEKQAEAHAEAVRDAMTQGIATKADIARLEARIYRALLMQTSIYAGIVLTAFGGIVVALIYLLPS